MSVYIRACFTSLHFPICMPFPSSFFAAGPLFSPTTSVSTPRAVPVHHQNNKHGRSSRTKSRFLDLPPELRNRIYEFVLLPGRIMVSRRGSASPGSDSRSPRAIIQVCRQVRKESLPMYLHNNTFVLAHDFRCNGHGCLQYLQSWLQDCVPADCRFAPKEVIIPYDIRSFAHSGQIARAFITQAIILGQFVTVGLD